MSNAPRLTQLSAFIHPPFPSLLVTPLKRESALISPPPVLHGCHSAALLSQLPPGQVPCTAAGHRSCCKLLLPNYSHPTGCWPLKFVGSDSAGRANAISSPKGLGCKTQDGLRLAVPPTLSDCGSSLMSGSIHGHLAAFPQPSCSGRHSCSTPLPNGILMNTCIPCTTSSICLQSYCNAPIPWLGWKAP